MNQYTLAGLVTKIIYRNEDNAYTVFETDTDDGAFVCIGYAAMLSAGERVIATGEFVTHQTHGRQFSATAIETFPPDGIPAIQLYLESGTVKGIGKVLAERIVEEFGAQSLEVLEKEPARIARIKGINPQKARAFSERLTRLHGVKRVIAELSGMQIPPFIAIKLYKRYGMYVTTALQANPYILCEEDYDMNFEEVDQAATERFNISHEAEIRIKAGILYVLRHNSTNGHTFLPKSSLLSVVSGFLDVDENACEEAYEKLLTEEDIVASPVADLDGVFLSKFYKAEAYIANRLLTMAQTERPVYKSHEFVTEIEQKLGISYAKMQKRAILQSMEHSFFVLTGGPGTGKTTTLNGIIRLLETTTEKIELIAPTGRAAKRMSEVTSRPARTVHRFLGIEMKGSLPSFKHNESNLHEADVIILDEASMLEILLFESLLKALKPTARLILVGDMNQLPPVGAGNVLRDILASELFASVELNEIFRQARDSLIVVNAHRIHQGEYPEFNDRDNDFFLVRHEDKLTADQLIANLVSTRLPKAYHLSGVDDIQLITPTKKGEIGTYALNNALQKELNPEHKDKKQFRYKELIFRVGDKIMQIRNNYEIDYVSLSTGELGSGVFNGDIGKIMDIDQQGEYMLIVFDDRQVEYPFENLHQLDLAYAITVHKSQGSEYPVVVFAAFKGANRLQTRNLLYTAVTRARQIFVAVGEWEAMCRMCDNNKEDKRFSSLKYLLLDAVGE